jgi:hypothetical protein
VSDDGAKSAEEILRRFDTTIMETGDFKAAMEYAHPDMTIREGESLPYRDVYVGLEGLEQLVADVGTYWEFLAPLEITFLGVSESLAIGRIESPKARLRHTGVEVPYLAVEWATIRDGKIADFEVHYFDQKPLLDAAEVAKSQG